MSECRTGQLARTVVAVGTEVRIGLFGRHTLVPQRLTDQAGNLLLRADRAAGPCLHRMLEGAPSPVLQVLVSDLTPVPQPDRLRARVHLTGRVELIALRGRPEIAHRLGATADEPLVRFVPDSVYLERAHAGGGPVPAQAYRRARPDPLAGWESAWLTRLHREDPELLRLLAHACRPLGENDRVSGLAADSHGITLRIYAGAGVRDLRLDFARPAPCPCRARRSLDELINRLL